MGVAPGPSSVSVRFYAWNGGASEEPALPRGCELRSWRPAVDGAPRQGPRTAENWLWFALQRLGLFASDAFEELSIWRDRRMLHRLVVTPRWLRFPFMAPGDLQIGGLWTAPELRRTGLAQAAIAEANYRHAAPGRRIWYVVDEANAASIGLAEACGYRLVGAGRRTRPLGLPALGQFRLESVAAPKRLGGG